MRKSGSKLATREPRKNSTAWLVAARVATSAARRVAGAGPSVAIIQSPSGSSVATLLPLVATLSPLATRMAASARATLAKHCPHSTAHDARRVCSSRRSNAVTSSAASRRWPTAVCSAACMHLA
jgi:hypothetical protein